MRSTPEQIEDLRVLRAVQKLAQSELNYWQSQIEKLPLHGWSQEKHEAYCIKRIAEARTVSEWCFVQQMRIDPD